MLICETSFVYPILASRKELHKGFLPKQKAEWSGTLLFIFVLRRRGRSPDRPEPRFLVQAVRFRADEGISPCGADFSL